MVVNRYDIYISIELRSFTKKMKRIFSHLALDIQDGDNARHFSLFMVLPSMPWLIRLFFFGMGKKNTSSSEVFVVLIYLWVRLRGFCEKF